MNRSFGVFVKQVEINVRIMNSASINYRCMIKNARLNYRKTLTRIESDCTFRVGFSSLMNNISCTKQSNLFLHFFRTSKRFSKYGQT